MNSSSSPSILYLDDDDDDDDDDRESNQYRQTNISVPRASSSNEMNIPCKKRKLTDSNSRISSSIVNWSKRQRNDHYQAPSSRNFIDSHVDLEPILLDPDEYIIEEPDHQSFCSFDWTLQSQAPASTHLLPKRIPSNSMQTATRISSVSTATKNKPIEPIGNKPYSMSVVSKTDSNANFAQARRKPIAVPITKPSPALLSLPLPKPTSSIVRAAVQRGRPLKNSRIPRTECTPAIQKQPDQPQPSRPLSLAAPSTSNSTSEIRRQALNGTGIFSAFHDTKYYRCNICKFKSVTSATLLQHLFTHMFFCEHCSFYTYSHYNLSQHLSEKHHLTINDDTHDPNNPNSCDLLYVTRCPDGTFALCMDSSLAPLTSKTPVTDQRRILSSAAHDDQQEDKSSKKKPLKPKEKPMENDKEIVVLVEKRDVTLKRSHPQGKINQIYVSMKHRRCYSLRKSPCLHSLTLEYNICRERTIRQMSYTQEISTKRTFLTQTSQTRLIDEIARCLRSIVNQIADDEDYSEHSSLICTLPNRLLQPMMPMSGLDDLTKSLKLKNKYDQVTEQNDLYEREHSIRQNREYSYVLSSPENYLNEQSIISSLHSSLTNGDSIFTQVKIDKLPKTLDNTHRYLKGNLSAQTPVNHSNPKVLKATQPKPSPPNLIPSRPIIPKPPRPLPNVSVDQNNNSITSSKPKLPASTTAPSSVIVLD